MNSVRIVADSACDLPPALVEAYQISIVPITVRFGAYEYVDTDMSAAEFWQQAAKRPDLPSTAAPAPNSFGEVYGRLTTAGHDVICLTVAARQSAVFNAAWLASQEYGGRVSVFDSGSISLGIGLQVLAAAKQAMAGQNSGAIRRYLEYLRSRTSVIFVLDTVEWVRRGGRLDRLMPLVDRLTRTLRVRPIFEMAEGEMRFVGVVRSTHAAIMRLEEEVRQRQPITALAAAYTRGREAALDLVGRLCAMLDMPATDVIMAEAGPALAAHAGPNAIGAVVIRA